MSLWVPVMFLIPVIVFAIALRRVVRIAKLLKDPGLHRGELTDGQRSALRGLNIKIDEAKLRALAEKAAEHTAARSGHAAASRAGAERHTVVMPSVPVSGPVRGAAAPQMPTLPPAFDQPSRSPRRLFVAFAFGLALAAAIAFLSR